LEVPGAAVQLPKEPINGEGPTHAALGPGHGSGPMVSMARTYVCVMYLTLYIKCMCVWLLESEGSISISTDPKLSTKSCEKTCIILESLINCVFIPKNMWVENIDVG
jgi:hypothetical protein